MLLTFEEAVALLRNHTGWWSACFNTQQPIFQFFNREFVDALAHYLKEKRKISKSRRIILEVGAGSGLLSEELRKRGINIIATDDGYEEIVPVAPVELLDYHEAIRRFRPNIVICSWMPYQKDWTPAFRRPKYVKEYILIGESYRGCCGSDKTWKYHPGFEEVLLKDISQWSLCRRDYSEHKLHSVVISFRRYK